MTTSNFCAYSWLLFVPILYSWPFFLATHFGSCARLVEHKNAYLAITLIVCLDGLIWNPASSTPVLCLSVSISVIHFSGLRQRWEGAVSHSTVLPLSVWLSRQNRSTSTNRIVSLKLPESMTCLVPAWQWPRQLAPRVHYRPQWLPTWGGGGVLPPQHSRGFYRPLWLADVTPSLQGGRPLNDHIWSVREVWVYLNTQRTLAQGS